MDFENKQDNIEKSSQEKKAENKENMEISDVINRGEKELSVAAEITSDENKQAISHVENYPGVKSGDLANAEEIISEAGRQINQVIESSQKNVSQIIARGDLANQEKVNNKSIESKQEGPSQDDLRETSLIKRIDSKFSGAENGADFLGIAKKITEKIKSLPDQQKEVYWQKMLSLVKSEQNNDIYYYQELHDEALNELKMVEKNSILESRDVAIEDRITQCSSFEDLNVVLSNSGDLAGSNNNYDAASLKNIISDVKNFKLPLEALTRSAGLRDKVKKLLATPDSSIAIAWSEVKTANGSERWQTQNTLNPELIRFNQGNGWQLVSKSEYKEILHKAKEEEIGKHVDLLASYKKEYLNLDNTDHENKTKLGEKMNSIRNSIDDEFIFQKNSLSEIKDNLYILSKKTNTAIYKDLLDYVNSSENKFAGHQDSPLFKKIKSLKEGGN